MNNGLGEKYRIAILGICDGIVPLIKRICERRLDRERYEVCYSYEVSCARHYLYGPLLQEKLSEVEERILGSRPDILLLCNPLEEFLSIPKTGKKLPCLILAGEHLGFETSYPILYLPDDLRKICPRIAEISAGIARS